MKKHGILHPELSQAIAALGHNDLLVVADAGLPIPADVKRIDLAYAPGEPPFMKVLEAILSEMEVERAILATELNRKAPAKFRKGLMERLGQLPKVGKGGVSFVSHEEFKQISQQARVVVRTGEFTPYANVILVSGVVF